MDFHEYASIFRMLKKAKLADLADDIKANGQHVPIVIYDGKILDGRNRYKACQLAGVEPIFEDAPDDCDPVSLVLSLNEYRRHVATKNEWALAGGKAKHFHAVEAKKRMTRKPKSAMANLPHQKGTARDKAAEEFGLGGKTVDKAERILTRGSKKLEEAVRDNEISIDAGATLATLPKSQQDAIIRTGRDQQNLKKHSSKAAKTIKDGFKPTAEDPDVVEAQLDAAIEIFEALGRIEHGIRVLDRGNMKTLRSRKVKEHLRRVNEEWTFQMTRILGEEYDT